MMCEIVKDFVIRCIEQARSDDLTRAKLVFRDFTPEQMQEEYGQSGRTRQEILDGHTAYDQKCTAAIEVVKKLL